MPTLINDLKNISTAEELQLRVYSPPIEKNETQEKDIEKIDVISLFSGCGGIDLGFHQTGFNIKWANDIETRACEPKQKI